MVLSDLRIGQCARILGVNGGGELRRRLLDMGLTPKTVVKLVRVAPLGDPIELCLRGYNLSLRGEAARDIEVELLRDNDSPCACACRQNGSVACRRLSYAGDARKDFPPVAGVMIDQSRQRACGAMADDHPETASDPVVLNKRAPKRKCKWWRRNR